MIGLILIVYAVTLLASGSFLFFFIGGGGLILVLTKSADGTHKRNSKASELAISQEVSIRDVPTNSTEREKIRYMQNVKISSELEKHGNRVVVTGEKYFPMIFNSRNGVVTFQENEKLYATVPQNQIQEVLNAIQTVYQDEGKLPSLPNLSYEYVQKEQAKKLDEKYHQKGIKSLYHFTDKSNIDSIVEQKGLWSWASLENRGVSITTPGGSELSKTLDERKHLEDYVRLSFHPDLPMMHVAKQSGRVPSPVVLKIDPVVMTWENTLFSNVNAAASYAIVGGGLDDFDQINFDVIANGWKSEDEKRLYQAEVLVRTHIPLKYINFT